MLKFDDQNRSTPDLQRENTYNVLTFKLNNMSSIHYYLSKLEKIVTFVTIGRTFLYIMRFG